jgi:hypothetical protein
MAIEWDPTNTHAARTFEENPALLQNWVFTVAFTMACVGISELTEKNLPTFLTREAMLNASIGENSQFSFDPAIPECFIGMRVWGRHAQGDLTDAAFTRSLTQKAKETASRLSRRFEGRKPGDVIGNMKLEDKVAGKCPTCPSHHTQDVVHDGEKSDD